MYTLIFKLVFTFSSIFVFGTVHANSHISLPQIFGATDGLHKDTLGILTSAYKNLVRCRHRPHHCTIGNGILLKRGESMNFMCPGENNSFKSIPGKNLLRLRCLCEDVLFSGSHSYSLEDIRCKSNETQDIFDRGFIKKMYHHNGKGLTQINSYQYRHYEIGFVLNPGGKFLKIMEVVNDDENSRAHYVQSLVRANTTNNKKMIVDVSLANPKYCADRAQDVLKYFNSESEERSFSVQLGWDSKNIIDTSAPKYIDEKSNRILVPTYMASHNSMADPVSVLATNTLLNMAVQWKNIKEGNWAAIENHVNDMSTYFKRDLTVITGVHKNLRMKEPTFQRIIHMHLFTKKIDENMLEKRIPIPMYFIKIVIDPERKTGITFVTVNNPYITSSQGYILCANPVNNKNVIKWPTGWSPENFNLGYSYACHVDDFLVQTGYLLKDNIAAGIQSLMYIPQYKLHDLITRSS